MLPTWRQSELAISHTDSELLLKALLTGRSGEKGDTTVWISVVAVLWSAVDLFWLFVD